MKIFLYQRLDSQNKMHELISLEKDVVKKFLISDLKSLVSNIEEISNFDPNKIINFVLFASWDSEIDKEVKFIRYDEFEV